MAAIDRGEGHPVNLTLPADVPGRFAAPPRPGGLHDLAVALGHARRNLTGGQRPGRLVLRCGPYVAVVLRAQSPEPQTVPSPRITRPVPGQPAGLSYRQCEVELDGGRDRGWVLLDDGEIIADGELEDL